MTANMRVQRPEPIRSQVARLLRDAIVERRFQQGEALIERELCELTGASRPSVREALRQLEAEGLVSSVTGKGSIVATLTRADAIAIYEVRAVLEGLAGRAFAERASDQQRGRLHATVDAFAASINSATDLITIKNEFYESLYEGANNPIAYQMAGTLQRRITWLRATSLAREGRPAQTVRELRDILSAIDAGDGALAERRCRNHVAMAQAASLEQLPEG